MAQLVVITGPIAAGKNSVASLIASLTALGRTRASRLGTARRRALRDVNASAALPCGGSSLWRRLSVRFTPAIPFACPASPPWIANVEAFQLEPLRCALQSPRTNLLLADDVGLGKTIEAGLVVQELLLRHRARSVVIVCPPSLALKWQDEMREKFGLDFVIVNSELMAQVRRTHGLAANPFRLFPRVIVSMAWLPTLRARRLLRDVYAQVGEAGSARRFAFDVLVVDEAHHIAPSSPSATGGGRGYAVDSQRTLATRELAKVCEHRLIDVFSRRIVGWAVTSHLRTELPLEALEHAIWDRRERHGRDVTGLIHQSDRGTQGGFKRWSQRLDRGGVDGQACWVDEGIDWPGADEVAGKAVAAPGRGAVVLA
jgi:hypothetical protein